MPSEIPFNPNHKPDKEHFEGIIIGSDEYAGKIAADDVAQEMAEVEGGYKEREDGLGPEDIARSAIGLEKQIALVEGYLAELKERRTNPDATDKNGYGHTTYLKQIGTGNRLSDEIPYFFVHDDDSSIRQDTNELYHSLAVLKRHDIPTKGLSREEIIEKGAFEGAKEYATDFGVSLEGVSTNAEAQSRMYKRSRELFFEGDDDEKVRDDIAKSYLSPEDYDRLGARVNPAYIERRYIGYRLRGESLGIKTDQLDPIQLKEAVEQAEKRASLEE